MQDLYRNLALESSKRSVARHKELQMNHEKALAGLRLNHETAVPKYFIEVYQQPSRSGRKQSYSYVSLIN